MREPTLQHVALPGDLDLVRPWVGVVVTEEGTVLLDSGNGPLHAAAIQDALDLQGAPPVTHIPWLAALIGAVPRHKSVL